MATGAGKKQARGDRERVRAYQARQEFYGGRVARRRRDNLVAGVAGGALILAVVGGQIAYYTLGPGAPEPQPSPSPSGSVPTPEPSGSDAPSPSASPSPTATP